MAEFKKGDPVYFHSHKHGTIPAEVLKVGRVNDYWTKHQGQVLIEGNFPLGDRRVWVDTKNCELQKGSEDYNSLKKVGAKEVGLSAETEVTFECGLCWNTITEGSLSALVLQMNEDGWRRASVVQGHTGIFCPNCIKGDDNG